MNQNKQPETCDEHSVSAWGDYEKAWELLSQHARIADQQRAEFEAWYINSLRAERPLFAEWSDSEIRSACMYPEGGSYKVDSAKWMWQAWQAARRAQVVPQGEIVVTKNDFGHIVAVTRQNEEGTVLSVVAMSAPIFTKTVADEIAKIAAAPQPPSA